MSAANRHVGRNDGTGQTTSGGNGNYGMMPTGNGDNHSVPAWYRKILAWMAILTAVMLVCFTAVSLHASDGTVREKLPAGVCISADTWMDDRLGWITDKSAVTDAMDYFMNKTGVQPYLLITDSLDGKGGNITDLEAEEYLANLYDSLYDDEGHMIFTFMEYAESEYITYLYTGTAADSVIDTEARQIFLSNADRYYTDSSLSDDEFFAKVFEKSADTIMKDRATASMILGVLAAGCGVITVLLAGGFILFKIREQKAEEAKTLQEIINAPIGQSPEEQVLEQKYAGQTQQDVEHEDTGLLKK